jgi:carbon monoxide dehydrogenase subunit G
MFKVEATILVDRPASEVWEYIADLDNLKAFDPGVVEVQWQRPLTLGAVFVITIALRGLHLVGDARVTDLEPGRRIGWDSRPRLPRRVTGGGRSHLLGVYVTDPDNGGRTRLTRVFSGEGHGALRLAEPFIGRLARAKRFDEISNLKRILDRP